MKIYKVKAPNGNIYRVSAPEGETDEDIFGFVQEQIRTQNQAAGKTEQEAVNSSEYGTENSYESENAPWYRDLADVSVGFTSGVSKAAGAIVCLLYTSPSPRDS